MPSLNRLVTVRAAKLIDWAAGLRHEDTEPHAMLARYEALLAARAAVAS